MLSTSDINSSEENNYYSHRTQRGNAIKKYVYHLPKIPNFYNNICYPTLTEAVEYCIPALICPGMQKSGTTFFYGTVTSMHPHVAESKVKEVNYFVAPSEVQEAYPSGVVYYASNFINNETQLILDVSVKYLMTQISAPLINTHMRGVKLMILLRDPVDRAYSHFQYQKLLYRKHLNATTSATSQCTERGRITFKQYLVEEYEVLKECGLITWNHTIVCFALLISLCNEN